jgi:hypothetical protein
MWKFKGGKKMLQLRINSSLLQNSVCSISRCHCDGNTELFVADRAAPHLMTAFTLPHKITVVHEQDFSQWSVKTATHLVCQSVFTSELQVLKLNADGVGVYLWKIIFDKLRRYSPDSLRKSFISLFFSHKPYIIANSCVNTILVGHLNDEQREYLGLLGAAGANDLHKTETGNTLVTALKVANLRLKNHPKFFW